MSFESPDSRFNAQVDEALSGVVPLAYVVAFANGGAKDVTQRCGPAHPPQSSRHQSLCYQTLFCIAAMVTHHDGQRSTVSGHGTYRFGFEKK